MMQFDEIAWKALDVLPEPLFILSRAGEVQHANMIARKHFSISHSPRLFSELAVSGGEITDRSIVLWLRNGAFVQGLMSIVDRNGKIYSCTGTRLNQKSGPPMILVRAQVKAESNKRFSALTQRILELNGEIARRNKMEAELYHEKERLEVTLHSIGDAVITTDQSAKVSFMNPVAESLTGWTEAEAVGKPLDAVFRIINEHTREPVENPVHKVLRDGTQQTLAEHTVLINRDGSEFTVEDSAAPIRTHDGKLQGVIMVFHDVTEAHKLHAEISYQATHDSLTGLLNREAFEKKLRDLLIAPDYTGRCHSLLFLDLDQFKVINDTSGHVAGDALLRTLATVMARQLRSSDTLARLGGDEFAVLLQDCPPDVACEIANELRQVVSDFSFAWENRPYNLGVSIGQINFSDHRYTVVELLKAADSACFMAKDAGRNRIHVCTDDDQELSNHQNQMEWVVKLEEALNEDRFVLFYQPVFPVKSAASLPCSQHRKHIEILLRLSERDGRTVAPGVFIPAAERYNLMERVDEWVLRSAIKLLSEPEFSDIKTCAINLSAASITNSGIVSLISGLVSENNLDPGRLCFEITETAAISNLNRAAQIMESLKKLGCRFALDDFGSGMASFSYLKYLPVDFLKIDGAFVRDMVNDPVDRAMVKAINDVGQALGIATIAEFVENDDIIGELKEIGVGYAQGFGLAKPEALRANPLNSQQAQSCSGNPPIFNGVQK